MAGFINARRYQEALNVLDQIKTRNAMWFYYSAIAMNGIGNNITAVEYAQTAAQMEPGNLQYMLLLQQLRGDKDSINKVKKHMVRHLVIRFNVVIVS
ncbi:hypothetical protein SD457_25800 [Coprobacillaceae bacterium CR2/5/TPMF4]|nr:hypothetical protein SD457_25800 [Coprobacillaceae bacterium CR2/5/TPMF4]